MNKKYSILNTITGWAVFVIAAITYLSTLEPTASFWDCGEFIASAYKLEVGHPPGAPFFLLVGRLFTLFAGGDTSRVAWMVNALSGLVSAFTILFLFWTITHLVHKMLNKAESEPTKANILVTLGSGLIGALAYTFSDTFWFSAVEGEVYASSSLFTAVVFWAILKWENVAGKKYSNRWLILIAYLMGLSIGVHLLNLLAIPAIVLIYYFKKYTVTRNGVLAAIGVSAIILGGIMYVLIPGLVKFAAFFERIFVNSFGLPYFSGVLVYFLLILGLIIYGLKYSYDHGKVLANTVLLVVTVIIIGYSSYALIVIRSQANPPMDQNNPENMFNLLSYLNREQYGDRPLVYGQYFNARALNAGEGKKVYAPVDGKYEVVSRKLKYEYSNDYKTIFPRVYSGSNNHIDAYLRWTDMSKNDLFQLRRSPDGKIITDRAGNPVHDYSSPKSKPAFSDNIRFFIRYQINHMYFRYFMWNFSGRQNDIQSQFKDEITKGNWLTGIRILDEARLGNQKKVPLAEKNNRARNRFFLLPLLLGIIGMIYQYRTNRTNFWVVATLFFLTGIAIVIYLNQPPLQPRERDYAYAGSFYAFAIWIGMSVVGLYKAATNHDLKPVSQLALRGIIGIGVLGIFDFAGNSNLTITWTALFVLFMLLLFLLFMKLIGSMTKNKLTLAVISFALLVPVPLLMARENWDDHDRSGRYVALDFASNYLNSCEENATLFTNGDNDTFPLWYAQEVEGVRTDIRVINLSYLSADWYIEQMERKAYESDPLKMTLTKSEYQQGSRDLVALVDRIRGHADLKQAIEFLATENSKLQPQPGQSEPIYHLPQHQFKMSADSAKVFANGTIKPEMADKFLAEIQWKINQNYMTKNHVMAYDFLATNNWDRPFYYAITVSNDNYIGLDKFFEMNGLAYRVIPALTTDGIAYSGGINTSLMYESMMNKFKWGGIENPDVYLDENSIRMFSNMRHNFGSLAQALFYEGKVDSAVKVLDRSLELIPNERISFNVYMLSMVDTYYKTGNPEKARFVADNILINTYAELEYYLSLGKPYSEYLPYEKRLTAHALRELIGISQNNGDKEYSASIQQELEKYGSAIESIFH